MLLFAAYFFEPVLFWRGMIHARWTNFDPAAFRMSVSYRRALDSMPRRSTVVSTSMKRLP